MVMGVKYALLACSQPNEIVQFTLNHLDEIEGIIGKQDTDESAVAARKCVQAAASEIVEVCNSIIDEDNMRKDFKEHELE